VHRLLEVSEVTFLQVVLSGRGWGRECARGGGELWEKSEASSKVWLHILTAVCEQELGGEG